MSMNIIFHMVINFLFSLLLLYLNPEIFSWNIVLFITLIGVLIDIDHLFYYSTRMHRIVDDFVKKIPHFYAFHTIEFLLLLALLSFFSMNIFFIFIGVGVHLVTAILTYIPYGAHSRLKYWSVIYYLAYMKKSG